MTSLGKPGVILDGGGWRRYLGFKRRRSGVQKLCLVVNEMHRSKRIEGVDYDNTVRMYVLEFDPPLESRENGNPAVLICFIIFGI